MQWLEVNRIHFINVIEKCNVFLSVQIIFIYTKYLWYTYNIQ